MAFSKSDSPLQRFKFLAIVHGVYVAYLRNTGPNA